MRGTRLKVAGATAVAGLALLVAPAMAGSYDYEGKAQKDENNPVRFDVKEGKKRDKVAGFFAGLPYHCTDESDQRDSIFLDGKLKLNKKGKFSGKLKYDSDNSMMRRALFGYRTQYKLKGKVKKNGKARGTIDATQTYFLSEDRNPEEKVRCYSGGLKWKASEVTS